jgi:hypothetical protein
MPLIDNNTTYPLQTVIDDTDQFVLIDKVEGAINKSAWSVIKSTLKTYFDTLYTPAVVTHKVRGFVSNPQVIYTSRAQIVMFRAEAAITITRIHIACYDYSPTAELAGDLKFADDINNGGFANATVIDVCDTTNGVVTITSSFDDATVPSGKYVYFQMDASPHADIKDFYIEVYYTVD